MDATPHLELVGANTLPLGRLTLFDKVEQVFYFTNRSDQTLSISGLRRTCPCITASYDMKNVPPGGCAAVHMVLDLAGMHGPFKRSLWVLFPGSARKQVLLSLTGEVIPLFDGLPPTGGLDLYATDLAHACWTNRYTLTPSDPRLRLDVPHVATNNANLQVDVTLTTNAVDTVSYALTLIIRSLALGHAKTQLFVPVTGIGGLEEQLFLKIASRTGLSLSAKPDLLYLVPSTRPTLRRILIRTDTESADPSLLTWTPHIEGLSVDAQQTKKKSGLLVTLQFTPEAVAHLLSQKVGSLTFGYTNHVSAAISIKPAGVADADADEDETSEPDEKKE